jgi:hypothetical protein
VLLRLLPLSKREAETIELRLEATQPLFKAGIVFVHRGRCDDTQKEITRDLEALSILEVGLQTN